MVMFLCISPLFSFAQFCEGIPVMPYANQNISNFSPGADAAQYNVKVYFHIYTRSDFSGGVPLSELDDMIDILNSDFSDSNISFYYNPCETSIINSDVAYDYHESIITPDNFTVDITQCFYFSSDTNGSMGHDDGLDIRLRGDGTSFIARAKGIPSKELIIGGIRQDDNVLARSSHILTHEMGHCLGLLHTHAGTCAESVFDCSNGQFSINPPNENGDFIDDTNPDPIIGGSITENCKLNYDLLSSNALNGFNCATNPWEQWDPDVTNYMSYTRPSCMDHFTYLQGTRMRSFLNNQLSEVTGGEPFEVNASVAATTCGFDNGSITVSPSGGSSPYTIEWSDGQTDFSLSDLAPGTYTATVTDDSGCSITIVENILGSSEITVDVSVLNTENCGTSDGSVHVDISNGESTYTYSLSDSTEGTSNNKFGFDINNLSNGPYTITVTDADGCTNTDQFVLSGVTSDNGTHLWSDLVGSFGLDNQVYENNKIYIKDVLIINQNYTFRNIAFQFAPGAELIIQSDKNVQILDNNGLRSSLMACSDQWKGITVQENATLTFHSTDIYQAERAINALNGSTIDLDYNVFDGNVIGIYLNGDVNITKFDRNKIQNGSKGVYAKNTNKNALNLVSENGRNDINSLDIGIDLYNAVANIQNNDINTKVGINGIFLPSGNIQNNNIGFNDTGIKLIFSTSVQIKTNNIGHNTYNYGTGIGLGLVTDIYIYENIINATTYGINGYLVQAEINSNVIDIPAWWWVNGGINLDISKQTEIVNNVISGFSQFGITSSGGMDNTIHHNEIYNSQTYPFTAPANIRLFGSSSETVNFNILSGQTVDGILLKNSSYNSFHCNEVTVSATAFNVSYNSEFQDIEANGLSGNLDLVIRSVIGEQIHKGNKFFGGSCRAYGLSDVDILESQFLVDSTYAFHMPSDPVPSEGWFVHEMGKDTICDGSAGPTVSIYSDPTRLCDYIDRIAYLEYSNPNLYHIRLMHIINYLKYHHLPIPECIETLVTDQCSPERLVSAYQRLIQIITPDDRPDVRMAQSIILESMETGSNQDLSAELATVKNAHEEKLLSDSLMLVEIRTTLDSIDCPDSLRQIWKEVLLAYVDKLQGIENIPRQTSLRSYAQLCAYEYGDAIHWARALLSDTDHTDYEQYDDCRTDRIGERMIPSGTSHSVSSPALYPNPSTGSLTLELPIEYQSADIKIYTIQGQLIWSKTDVESARMSIDLDAENGTYIMKITPKEGEVTFHKFTVIK